MACVGWVRWSGSEGSPSARAGHGTASSPLFPCLLVSCFSSGGFLSSSWLKESPHSSRSFSFFHFSGDPRAEGIPSPDRAGMAEATGSCEHCDPGRGARSSLRPAERKTGLYGAGKTTAMRVWEKHGKIVSPPPSLGLESVLPLNLALLWLFVVYQLLSTPNERWVWSPFTAALLAPLLCVTPPHTLM